MKDFYGTSLPTTNPELDYSNMVIINNAFSDTSKKVQSYTPTKDGIFIIGCSYQAGAYAWIVDEALSAVRRISCVIASSGAVAQMNGTCQANRGHNYRCESVRGQWFFIPYKQ
jgi:hypothetical protein